MADEIHYQIHGDNMQIVEIGLDAGQAVIGEPGAMTFMTEGIEMQTSTGGGVMSGLKRVITGETFFLPTFRNRDYGRETVGFAAPYPGHLLPLDLRQHNGSFIVQRDAFLCAAHGIEVSIFLNTKIGSGLFGGEGFILQRLRGDGLAFIHAGGNMVQRQLKPGESIRIETGCLLGFSEGMDYDIQYVGGVLNPLFGGEGLFVTKVTGPGIVFIQSLPFSHLVDRLGTALARSKHAKKFK